MTVTSLLLGLDVSPRRLGWGMVDLVTGEPVACGMEPIDLPDHGWHHKQVRRALIRVDAQVIWDSANPRGEVQAVYIECPISRFPGMAYDEGRAVGETQAEVERRWPHAPIEYLMPSEWKKLAGLKGNASKGEVWAQAGRILIKSGKPGNETARMQQDAADALLIAVAGWHRNEDVMERARAMGAA
jgi:Holliday junction resolvasome RuvABC endonuclease subunit